MSLKFHVDVDAFIFWASIEQVIIIKTLAFPKATLKTNVIQSAPLRLSYLLAHTSN
jgi:hypothetical protein